MKKSYFRNFGKPTCYKTDIRKTIPYWALTKIFFCFCFIFPWFPRRGVAEPWGGPDRRELLGELVWCSEVDVPMCCYLHIRATFLPTCLLIFDVTIFPLHKVLRKKTPWIQWFNRSFSPLGYILLVVVDGDKQSPFTIDPWPRWIVCAAALKLLPPVLLEGHLPDKP